MQKKLFWPTLTVSIWTDGPASQFKNRFIAAAIRKFELKQKITIHWNFFATSHGNGIGGSVKRQVWTAVQSRKNIVQNAASFATVAKNVYNVNIKEKSQQEIDVRNDLKIDQIFKNATPIPGISRYHHLCVNDKKVDAFILTDDATLGSTVHSSSVYSYSSPSNVIDVDDWCVVNYDGKLYPVVVQAAVADNYEVSVLLRAGKNWKWPDREDKIYYTKSNVIKKLSLPIIVNARDHYKFTDFE